MEQKRTDLKTIGEFGLIQKIADDTATFHPGTIKGIGDDAAVLMEKGDKAILVSTDMLLEGVHFDLAYMPLKHLGYKAMTVNFSDMAAMNALPKQVTIGLALSNRFSAEAVEELYKGIHQACARYQVDLVGGDTTSSRSGLVISVTVIGYAHKDRIVYRSGAKKGDVICVTGDLGAAYLGLQILEREKQVYLATPDIQPDLDAYTYLVERQLKPEARTDMVHEFKEKGVLPTAMIDISDGLASEILHISKQSNVSAVIYEEKLPVDPMSVTVAGNEFRIPVATCALNGGEDYELLFSVSQEDFKKIEFHPEITPIGYFREAGEPSVLVTRAGQTIPLQAQGWQHFGQ